MRSLIIAVGFATLGACSQQTEKDAPTPSEVVAATAAPSDAEATAPAVLTAVDLRRVCRAGLAAVHGQRADAIEVDGLEGSVINASWRAPVDGGRMKAQCRVEGDLITYHPLERPDPEQNRWMNQSGDPVVRYVMDSETITINQTLPDGTTATEDYAVAPEQEAR